VLAAKASEMGARRNVFDAIDIIRRWAAGSGGST
jgi:hypothetical protein